MSISFQHFTYLQNLSVFTLVLYFKVLRVKRVPLAGVNTALVIRPTSLFYPRGFPKLALFFKQFAQSLYCVILFAEDSHLIYFRFATNIQQCYPRTFRCVLSIHKRCHFIAIWNQNLKLRLWDFGYVDNIWQMVGRFYAGKMST